MTKFVKANCACGVQFQREVKRGRPSVWCPACLEIPFYKRTPKSVSVNLVPASVDSESSTAPTHIVNENDPLDAVRAEIEAGMVVINDTHKARFAELVLSGMRVGDVAVKVQAETFAATTELYGQFRKTKVMMPKDETAE